jgi:hypothetical protein
MTTARDRIQSLVQRGTVPPDEAEALLAAVGARGRPRWASVLLDPLECFGAVQLTLVGLGVALLGIALERFGMAFDGFLDMHRTDAPWSLKQSLARALVAWPFGSLVLWLGSLVAGRQGRVVDFLGLVGVARLPIVLFAIPIAVITAVRGIPGAPGSPGSAPAPVIFAIVVFALAGVGWNIVLSYRGFVTASGLRGGKRIVAYVAAVLIAEFGAKFILASIA